MSLTYLKPVLSTVWAGIRKISYNINGLSNLAKYYFFYQY